MKLPLLAIVGWVVFGSFGLMGCASTSPAKAKATASTSIPSTSARIQHLKVEQRMNLPGLCSEKPLRRRQLVMFASQYCRHCHRMLDVLQKHKARFKAWRVAPVVLWTDLPNCIKARMAGAHYPMWAFGRPSVLEQQAWAVEATPVMYLLDWNRPILRIDGAISEQQLLAAIRKAIQG
ncbi:MAG: hypothetical protein EP343_12985 [Deltaproteobacteria bacterium]|nr:MAG: hypothetical protein EP343_12985 [Deltaproteobacteria bacterium]